MRYGGFIKRDIDYINDHAAWTDDQAAIFKHLLAGKLTDVGIMQTLHIGDRKYYRIKKEIERKIAVVLQERDG